MTCVVGPQLHYLFPQELHTDLFVDFLWNNWDRKLSNISIYNFFYMKMNFVYTFHVNFGKTQLLFS